MKIKSSEFHQLSPVDRALELHKQQDFFALLETTRRQRWQPTGLEWMLMQDCLDDVFRRSSVTWCLFFAVMAWPMRHAPYQRTRGSRHFPGRPPASLRRFLPLYAGLVGWELGLRDRNVTPATDFFAAMVRIDSEIGEAARRLSVKKHPAARGHQQGQHAASPPAPPLQLLMHGQAELRDRLPRGVFGTGLLLLRSLTLENVLRDTLAGSYIAEPLPEGGYGYVRLRVGCRYWCATLVEWKRTHNGGGSSTAASTTHSLAFGPIAPVLCGPQTSVGQVLRNRRLIRERTDRWANWWWGFTLWGYERCSLL